MRSNTFKPRCSGTPFWGDLLCGVTCGMYIVAVLMGVLWLMGCTQRPIPTAATKLPEAIKTQEQSTSEIKHASQDISNQNEQIKGLAPELEPHTTAISSALIRIDSSAANLIQVSSQLRDESARAKVADANVVKLQAQVKDLEASRYGLISKLLAFVAVAALIAGVVGVFVFRLPSLGVAGGILFTVCIGAQWLLSYALVIGIVVISLLIAGAIYIMWSQHITTRQIVGTVEAIKPNVPDFKTIANGIQQSKMTRWVVDHYKSISKAKP